MKEDEYSCVFTCNRHPGVSGYVGDGLSAWSGGLRAGVEGIDDGAGGLMVELGRDGHGGGSGADGTGGGNGGTVLVMMAEGVVDHGVGGRHISS